MKTFSKILATGVFAAASIIAVPALANYGDFGQEVFLEQKQKRLVPQGISGIVVGQYQYQPHHDRRSADSFTGKNQKRNGKH